MMQLSVIIPVYNERENIAPMIEALSDALHDIEYEIIFVDDGSGDGTINEILAYNSPKIKLVAFARNFGQTSAMAAGIEYATGEFIATLDGDLQNDPADIPMLLSKLIDGNYDLIAGRRRKRQDGLILRKIPSKIANWIIRKATKVNISDYGCTLKVFRADIAKGIDLYGELHRFIPILVHIYGGKITEIEVRHHPRRFGVSKYGISRTFRVISDLLLMIFFLKFRQKPMHLFGTIGISMFAAGGMIEFYLLMEKFMGHDIGGRPLFYVGILLLILSVQFITSGFLAEILMRTYFESQNRRPYRVKAVYQGGKLADNARQN